MCMNSTNLIPCTTTVFYSAYRHRRPSRRKNLRVLGLCRSKRSTNEESEKESKKTEMKMKNLKLFMENQSIIEENEKLRKKAILLHQENQALLSQLQGRGMLPISHNHFT